MKKTLQHPAHGHALCLRDLSDEFTRTLKCSLCEMQIYGSSSINCCEQCRFFLHKSCSDLLVSEIQHPFHSLHPLVLVHEERLWCTACHCLSELIFRCDQCNFKVDARCALATLPLSKEFRTEQEDESNVTIEHFAHNHPLTSLHANMEPRIECRACGLNLSEDIFGCYDCIFFLHKKCAELPREMQQHLSHSQHRLPLVFYSERRQCDLCGKHSKSFYRCDECQFDLHSDCALSVLALENQKEENGSVIHYPFHDHQLSSFHVKTEDKKVKCKACDVMISGEAYGCSKCLYFLHKSCAQLPTEIKHPLHDKHHLTLKPNNYFFTCTCCTCRRRGFSFSCETCRFPRYGGPGLSFFTFDLDVECALQYPTDPEQADSPQVKLSTHHHPLKHIFVTKSGGRDCGLCKRSIEGEAYQCYDMSCNYRFHKSCAETPAEIRHVYHPQHPLTLPTGIQNTTYICNACGMSYDFSRAHAVIYGCGKCNFYLDFNCATRKTLRHHLHEHILAYFEEGYGSFRCNFCGHFCKIDFYGCSLCNFNIHRDCSLLLPKTYKHRRHIHPLTLHHAICDDDFGEYCCDICEKDRNPDCGVYYCELCNYVAHIECVIPVADPGSNIISGTKETLSNLQEIAANLQEKINKLELKLDELKKKLEEVEPKRVRLLALKFEAEHRAST